MNRKISFLSLILSLFLHATILSILIDLNIEDEMMQEKAVTILLSSPSEEDEEGDKADEKQLVSRFIDMSIKSKDYYCPHYYAGIGIRFSWLLREVIDVAPGGPADRAGVRVGDILINDPYNDRETIGETRTYTIKRGDQVINITMVTEKICGEL